MKRFKRILALAMVIGVLGGCSGFDTEELYCLPEATEDYRSLQEALTAMLDSGYSYVAPTSGPRQETVRLVDLDEDGVDEAVAFFRSAADESISGAVFARADGGYETAATFACTGSGIGNTEYVDVDLDGRLEIILTCQVSQSVTQALQVYRYDGTTAEAVVTASCDHYALVDLDGDRGMEFLCISNDGDASATVRCYEPTGELREPALTLPVSYDSILNIQEGALADGGAALFLSARDGEGLRQMVIAMQGNTLTDVAEGNAAALTGRLGEQEIFPADVDGDGQTELAVVEKLEPYDEGSSPQSVVDWYSVSAGGGCEKKLRTYLEPEYGWLLTLPEAWDEALLIRAGDKVTKTLSVHSVDFFGQTGEKSPMVTICTVRGDERQSYVEEQKLTVLYSGTDTILAVRLDEERAGISMAQLSEEFRVISSEQTTIE